MRGGHRHKDAGRALERNTTSPLPIPSQAASSCCGRLPAHSLPCASAALLASEPRDGAKSPPLPSRSLPRGARLGRRLGRAWHPARGAGSGGPAGSGTPPAICHPGAELQLAILRPQAGAPNGFLAKAAGKIAEVWLFGLGVSYISLSKGFTFLSLFLHLSHPVHAVLSFFSCPCT